MSDIQQLAEEYIDLSARIKNESAALAAVRKDLKTLDGRLLNEMRKSNVMEVTARGVVIQRTNKLQVKS
jgi:hypothetical protein